MTNPKTGTRKPQEPQMIFHSLSPELAAQLRAAVNGQIEHVRRFRRALHQIPEKSMEEHKTSGLIQTELTDIGLPFEAGLAGTGIAADLDTGREGGYVVLRSDMDALPICETTGVPYHSRHEGYAHSCGHDGHAAVLLGVARVLTAWKDRLKGRIRFIFQPAEELARGAQEMIEAGVLCGRKPDAIFALHGWPGLETGHVACRGGTMMAACDSFEVTIVGRGGHGARPHLACNPLQALAPISDKFLHMNSDTRVVSPCIMRVGDKNNVIADRGTLAGSLRTLDHATRELTMREMHEVAEKIAISHGARAEVSFETGCPRVESHSACYELFVETAAHLLGDEAVHVLDHSSMGSEDFGFYLEHVPGLMFRLGVGENSPELHNSAFNFNDEALPGGMLTLAGLALRVAGYSEKADR